MDFRPFEEACQRFPLMLLKFQRSPAAVAAKQSLFYPGPESAVAASGW